LSKWIIEKLDVKKHNRDSFDCGVDVLNVYLKIRANQEQKKRLNVTYVAVSKEGSTRKDIVGYYTLSNSAIALYVVNENVRRHIPPTYAIPTVKIGRLAASAEHQKQGIGKRLLQDACRRIVEMSSFSGIKGIEVVSKSEAATQFYKSFGFHLLLDNDNTLFLPIETILKS